MKLSVYLLLLSCSVLVTKSNPAKPKITTEKPVESSETIDEPNQEVGEEIESPPVVNNGTKKSVIALDVDTSNKLNRWGEAAKNAVKKPTEIIKDSVNLMKDSVKMGAELGEAAVAKGIAHLGKQGVTTATDLGKMGINMGTTIANNTLGLIHKIGDMMPVGGRIVKGGVSFGRKGLTAAKALGENLLDNIMWWADSGFGWLRANAATSKTFLHNKTDSIASSIQNGLDNGAGRIGNFISTGIKKLPIFKVNASLSLG